MKAGEIFTQVPGLSRSLLQYFELRGYIKPQLVQRKHIARRDYSEQDLHMIKTIWHYREKGFKLSDAYLMAIEQPIPEIDESQPIKPPVPFQNVVIDRINTLEEAIQQQNGILKILAQTVERLSHNMPPQHFDRAEFQDYENLSFPNEK